MDDENLPMSLLLALLDDDGDPSELGASPRRGSTLPGLPPPPRVALATNAPSTWPPLG